jgi:hypothetical protein
LGVAGILIRHHRLAGDSFCKWHASRVSGTWLFIF